MGVVTNPREGSRTLGDINGAILKGYSTTSNNLYELNEEVSDDIQLEDRKMRRGITDGVGHTEVEVGQHSTVIQTFQNNEVAAISYGDLPVTNQTLPAELARQASHQQ